MAKFNGDVIARFDGVSFEYAPHAPVLAEASFGIREKTKITLMGQNGAGKSTVFALLRRERTPNEGRVSIRNGVTIGHAPQTMPREWLEQSIRAFFLNAFPGQKIYDIDPRALRVLEAVNLKAPLDRIVGQFSGGEQARLLLAFALIENPDILLLDEPTNNLDKAGIEHLTKFLVDYDKTCIVISHDADFLNAFTHGVLYLDAKTHTMEQYAGDYFAVVAEIAKRIERERMLNVRLEKEIEHRKEQANFFAQKGGKMRDVARKMKEKIEELKEAVVDVREEDRALRPFTIPSRAFTGPIIEITAVPVMRNHKLVSKKIEKITLKRGDHLLLAGPNGAGKTTFLEMLAAGKAKGAHISKDAVIGYYRQDFTTLAFDESAYAVLASAARNTTDEKLRSTAAQFLITAAVLKTNVADLSAGQKGLLSFARLALLEPTILLLDEPTNHINFRHLPAIAEAIHTFRGAVILVSHMKKFVEEVKITKTLNLGKL